MSGHLLVAATASPASSWTLTGRVAAATTLVLGAALPLTSHLSQPTLSNTDDALAWAVANPGLANLTKVLDVAALPFLFGSALVYVLLSRRSSPRLAYSGGIMLGCGLVGLSAVEGYEILLVDLAGDNRTSMDVLVEAASQTAPAAILMVLMLIAGSGLGTLTLAVALWRSAAIPRLAAVMIPVPLVVDVVFAESLGAGPHWLPHAIALVTSCWIGWVLLSAGRVAVTEQPEATVA